MRFHTQTAGVSLTAQQPLNNIVRTAIEALAGVLGGTQSLHTNSYDEALALPTEEAVTIALRTQQIIAHETGVTNTVDPLGGSYFVEALTDEIEAQAYEYFAKIDELGGMVEAVKRNYPQREIADAAFALQQEIDAGERIVVGVNSYTAADEEPIPTLRDRPGARAQADRPPAGAPARARDGAAVERALARAARGRRARGAQPDGAAARLRPRARHRGRDRRVAAAGVRRLHRDARLLSGDAGRVARGAGRRRRLTPRRPRSSTRRVEDSYRTRAPPAARRRSLGGGALVALSSATTLALASKRIVAEQAAFRAPAAARCVPTTLNRSAVLPGTSLAVSPLPGSYDASARTQISLLGAPPGALSDVRVEGSRSGSHAGRLRALLPGRRRELRAVRARSSPGETVTRARRGCERGLARAARSPSSFVVATHDALPLHAADASRRARTPTRSSTSTRART